MDKTINSNKTMEWFVVVYEILLFVRLALGWHTSEMREGNNIFKNVTHI